MPTTRRCASITGSAKNLCITNRSQASSSVAVLGIATTRGPSDRRAAWPAGRQAAAASGAPPRAGRPHRRRKNRSAFADPLLANRAQRVLDEHRRAQQRKIRPRKLDHRLIEDPTCHARSWKLPHRIRWRRRRAAPVNEPKTASAMQHRAIRDHLPRPRRAEGSVDSADIRRARIRLSTSVSIFSASSKSRSVRPPSLCVESPIRTLL